MKFSLIQAGDFDASLLNQWAQLRSQNAIYDNPYYDPAFSRIIAAARPDARILLCESEGHLQAVWPFQVKSGFIAESIGGFLSDYQGPICSPDMELPISAVLNGMGCRYFSFNHLAADIKGFEQYSWIKSSSHFLDLQGGYDAYAQRLSGMRDASVLKKVATNERKLSKKYGALRFELQSSSDDDYQALLDGKSDQFRRTVGEQHDIFKLGWVRQVVDGIRASDDAGFGGVLSSLYAGDTLIAAHFGMRSKNVLHFWFPWYRTDYAEYSPGLILLAQCARHAHQLGLTSIDLGRGDQAYKLRFATGGNTLLEGALSSPDMLRKMRAAAYHAKSYLKASSLGKALRKLRHTDVSK